jgi:hypothetical protein
MDDYTESNGVGVGLTQEIVQHWSVRAEPVSVFLSEVNATGRK